MDLLTTAEQFEIVDSSAAFLASQISIERTRELFESGSLPAVDDSAWSAGAELGWFALGLPEDRNGIGCGLVDEALLFREIGRRLAPGPFLSTVLAARVASFGGDQDLADEITAGRRVGLVIPGSLDALGADGVITGDVQLVDADPDGLVLAVDSNVASLVDVSALDDLTEVPCIDPTARLYRARGNGCGARVSVTPDVDPIELRGHVLISALLTGIVEWSRDVGVEHAKNRVQFDKPIGVNQAIKHPCADMAVHAELAYAQTLFGALSIDEDRDDAEFQALSAHITTAKAAEFATAAALQIMGGMGFTHEHDVHLYVKRMEMLSHSLGAAGPWLDRLLALPEPA